MPDSQRIGYGRPIAFFVVPQIAVTAAIRRFGSRNAGKHVAPILGKIQNSACFGEFRGKMFLQIHNALCGIYERPERRRIRAALQVGFASAFFIKFVLELFARLVRVKNRRNAHFSVLIDADKGCPVRRYRQRFNRILLREGAQLLEKPVFHSRQIVRFDLSAGVRLADFQRFERFVHRIELMQVFIVYGNFFVRHADVYNGNSIFHKNS